MRTMMKHKWGHLWSRFGGWFFCWNITNNVALLQGHIQLAWAGLKATIYFHSPNVGDVGV